MEVLEEPFALLELCEGRAFCDLGILLGVHNPTMAEDQEVDPRDVPTSGRLFNFSPSSPSMVIHLTEPTHVDSLVPARFDTHSSQHSSCELGFLAGAH